VVIASCRATPAVPTGRITDPGASANPDVPILATDEHRSSAESRSLERRILNLMIDGVPQTGVPAQSSASVLIRVHLWPPIIG